MSKTRMVSFLNDGDHRFSEDRNAPDTHEANVPRSRLAEQLAKSVHREEFHVPAIPERREMSVHLSGDRKSQILEVAVVWGRQEAEASMCYEAQERFCECAWIKAVF